MQAMVEGLPEDRFPGADWQERWQRFFTSYAASMVVQGASASHNPADRLGIHDDAFSRGQRVLPIGVDNNVVEDYSSLPERLYATPANDDEERAIRLATLAEAIDLLPISYALELLDLGKLHRQLAGPVSVFFFAAGEPGTDAFVLRQSYPRGDLSNDRLQTVFAWNRALSWLPDPSTGEVSNVVEEINVDNSVENQDLWLGLVNAGLPKRRGMAAWALVVSPRLIPLGRGTSARAVRLVDGAPAQRLTTHEFYNGDDFVLSVDTTGQLHLGAGTRNDIPADERSIDLTLICSDSQRVTLADPGISIDAHATPGQYGLPTRYSYKLCGRIAPDNAITGECRARVELTSLLNLGGGDHQVDESFVFRLDDPRPWVESVRVRSGGTVAYDSTTLTLEPIAPAGGQYTVEIEVAFSTLMGETAVEITAGLEAPYDRYKFNTDPIVYGEVDWINDPVLDAPPNTYRTVVGTTLTVPESDVPEGGFLWFSIGGTAESPATGLDYDPSTSGIQPNTRHYVLLGTNDYYRATISMEKELMGALRDQRDDGVRESYDYKIEYQPIETQFRLIESVHLGAGRTYFVEAWRGGLDFVLQDIEYQRTLLAQFRANVQAIDDALAPSTVTGATRESYELNRRNLVGQIVSTEPYIAVLEAIVAAVRRTEADFQAVIRLLDGAISYDCHTILGGPVLARFGGMRGRYEERISYPPFYWGGDDSFVSRKVEIATYDAPGWYSHSAIPRLLEGYGHCPTLEVWHFDRDDLDRARALLAKAPDYVSVPPNEIAEDSPAVEMIAPTLAIYQDTLQFALEELLTIAWRFVPDPGDGIEMAEDLPVFRDNNPRLPVLDDGPMMRVRFKPQDVWPFMVDGHGQRNYTFRGRENVDETEPLTFANRRDAEADEPYYRIHSDITGLPRELFEEPYFEPIERGYDVNCYLAQGGAQQVTNRTHDTRYGERDETLVINGRAPRDTLEGTLECQWRSGRPIGDEVHLSQIRWDFVRNGLPTETDMSWLGQADLPPPLLPSTTEIAEGEASEADEADPPASAATETTSPTQPPAEAQPDDGSESETAVADPNAPPADDAAPTPLVDTEEPAEVEGGSDDQRLEHDEAGDSAADAPPEEAIGGMLGPGIQVSSTVRYTGVLTGTITNDSDAYEPGDVALYVEGPGLPPPDGQPILLDLQDGFPQDFVAIVAGGSVRLRNVEQPGGPSYTLLSESELRPFEIVLSPGDEEVIEFPDSGRLTVVNKDNASQLLELLVVPSTRINVLDGSIYMIRDIPPGPHELLSKVVYGFVMRRRDPGVLHSRI